MDKNQKKDHSISINCDNPFEPAWIYKMLSGMRSDSFVIEGRQEDAEEFLGFLLNGLNDEMLDVRYVFDLLRVGLFILLLFTANQVGICFNAETC